MLIRPGLPIVYERGILYLVDYYYAGILMIILFVLTLQKYRHLKLASEKRNFRSLMWAQMFVGVPVLSVPPDSYMYDYIPVFCSISVLAVAVPIIRGGFFGTINTARNRVFEQVNDGFITVDTGYRYLDSNRYATLLYPELKKLNTGDELPENIRKEFTECRLTVNEDSKSAKYAGNQKMIDGHYFNSFITPLTMISDEEAEREIDEYKELIEEKHLSNEKFIKKHILFKIISYPVRRIPQFIGDTCIRVEIGRITKESKKLVGYSLLMVDVTEEHRLLKQAEEEREKALAAARSKSDFLSNMSHEIRTPMNAIVGMTEILMREDLPDETKSYLLNIKNSGAALLSIINDILDFSKIESGKLEIIDDKFYAL